VPLEDNYDHLCGPAGCTVECSAESYQSISDTFVQWFGSTTSGLINVERARGDIFIEVGVVSRTGEPEADDEATVLEVLIKANRWADRRLA